jgi:[ribosomal protein S18]-alanine N-acetyltransferase
VTDPVTDRAEGGRIRAMRWWHIEPLLPAEQQLFGATAWTAETFWSELAAPGRHYLVAERAGGDGPGGRPELLGYAGLMVGGSEADVQTLAVLPPAQGQGWGGRLLRELITRAAAERATALLLEVRADNPAAIALYRRHGFDQLAIRRRYYQPGEVDALVMRLRPVRVPEGLADSPG